MKLDRIRSKIDEIDLELLALLEERMELGLRVRRFKTAATDPRREEAVLSRAMRSSLALVEADFAERLFAEIITESKRLQDNGHRLVAYALPGEAPQPAAAPAAAATGIAVAAELTALNNPLCPLMEEPIVEGYAVTYKNYRIEMCCDDCLVEWDLYSAADKDNVLKRLLRERR